MHGVVQFFRFCGNVFRSTTLGRNGKVYASAWLGGRSARGRLGRRAAESEERAAGSAGRACAGSAGGGVGCSLRIRGRVPGRCTEGEEAGCSFLLGDGTTGGERPVVLPSDGPPSSACRASAATNVVQWKWIECRARCSHWGSRCIRHHIGTQEARVNVDQSSVRRAPSGVLVVLRGTACCQYSLWLQLRPTIQVRELSRWADARAAIREFQSPR